MTAAHCVQRADLVGHQRILSVSRDAQPAASVKRVIGHWLGVVADIKAVLNILVSCRQSRFAAMECKSARINGSFAANAGLRWSSFAVIPGRKSAGMLVGPVSNASSYKYWKLKVGKYWALIDSASPAVENGNLAVTTTKVKIGDVDRPVRWWQ